MNVDTRKRREMERSYETISPFEFKDELIRLAKEHEKKPMRTMLNAGRGNPNWIAAAPREAFFALGEFALSESRRVWDEGNLAGMPDPIGIAKRFTTYANEHSDRPGMSLLVQIVDWGIFELGFDPDNWVHELADGLIGDNYPEPDRMLVHMEKVVHQFLVKRLYPMEEHGADTKMKTFDLFAVEGATAAMCYLFDSFLANHLLSPGDRIAVMVPIFPPYLEIPQLDRYNFDVVDIRATGRTDSGMHSWQYPSSELDKLKDRSVRALFMVNPSNPPSVAMDPTSIEYLQDIVKRDNPDLMIISDDVYGTFVDGYRSLMVGLPENTIGVYSLSKYFGVTGWRLGVIAVSKENVFDTLLSRLPEEQKEELNRRYASLTQHPEKLSFVDRLVADSRQVALNHTAGLSTPQQVQMALFAAFDVLDTENRYQKLTKDICRRRMKLLYDGLDLKMPEPEYGAYYYTEFDLAWWAAEHYSQAFVDYLQDNYEPVDILFRLAENCSIVLLNGGGFRGPTWSIRVSLANLADEAYSRIGKELHSVLEEYVEEWKSASH
ncbi:aspartate 4-decarboxylase [Alicyclobacillus ferrooxydans]|uniref:aspartate 4-decarboxylase n=1 Tax=Alicyclobacillus ferrooxydans TaxID=471514 RepID=UPI000AB6BFA8|nr:aspartate 4-decarboxylase [Alicyclobacillus ferrooxydans]